MIERQIVASNLKELKIQEYITSQLKNLGQSHIKLQKTPLGEKIVIYASRPGLIVGRKGQNIKKLTQDLKDNFELENPQIEINEVEVPEMDAQIVGERIAGSLEKFGTQRFKGIGHRVMADTMRVGALGIEILITGKIPSSRSKRWRFYQGYLKKCGDIALTGVHYAYTVANLKTGTVGIQVRIMPPETELPDKIELKEEMDTVVEEMVEKKAKPKDNKKTEKPAKKNAVKKKVVPKNDSTKKDSNKKEEVKKEVKKEVKEEKSSKKPAKKEEVKEVSKKDNPKSDEKADNSSDDGSKNKSKDEAKE